jgi:multidrug resistance efflux pump
MAAIAVTHEPASQRRHFRVTSPAQVSIGGGSFPTKDWSVGGFCIDKFNGSAQVGNRTPIQFSLDFQGFAITFLAVAEVVRMEGGSLAAKFIDLGERESELLRQFVSAIMTGQITPVEGVLKHLDRPVTKVALSATNEPVVVQRKRTVRRIVVSAIYVLLGLAIAAYALLTLAGIFMRVTVDTAVTSMPLEQVVSMDVGTIAELYVKPGAEVQTGQPLFRVDNEVTARNVEVARQELKSAEVVLREAESRTEEERKKLRAYQGISNNQVEVAGAKIAALSADRDEARSELARAKKLVEEGLISRQTFDIEATTVSKREAYLQQAIAEEKIRVSSNNQTTSAGYFFSGNFLVGDLQARTAEEASVRERLKLAQTALQQAQQHESRRVYRAPFRGTVMRVFKSPGMTVDRGENLVVLRRNGESLHIDAYLTQDEAARLATGSRGVAFISATGQRYTVEVVSIDRTAGFLKDIQTPKLQQPQFGWRNTQDRSAYAKLIFTGVSPAQLASIEPGLPVHLSIPRKRQPFHLLSIVEAASKPDAPRLWPAQSPLFSREGIKALDASVRARVIEAADHAVRMPPSPVETIHSAGVTDKESPELVQSRRAFQDADNFALLALAYKLTGKGQYLESARAISEAWARVNQPSGQPIDETRLDTFLWGLDLLGAETDTASVRAWLGRWQDADRAWRFGPNTETNNHKTHHLKILLMLDKVLGRSDQYEKDLKETERHVKLNLASADGSSLDYKQRDALHYHVFDLEAWNEIALVTGCCGANVDRAFGFFEKTIQEHPDHVEFGNSTAPIDRKRAAAGFDYAKAHAYEVSKAARAIFTYATLPGRQVSPDLWKAAQEGREHKNLFFEARYYLWHARD